MDLIIIIIGFFLILDGLLSIKIQLEEKTIIYHIGRVIRIGMGIFLVIYAAIFEVLGFVIDIFAYIIILDAILSLVFQWRENIRNHSIRIVRIILGIYLLAYSYMFLV